MVVPVEGLPMDVTIVPFDAPTASREAWAVYHRFRRIRHEEREPGDPILDDRAVETLMSRPDPLSDVYWFAALAPDGEVIGWLEFEIFKEGSPSHAQNPDMAWIWIEVLASRRRHGIGAALLARAADLARRHRRTILVAGTQETDGLGFLKRLDGRFVQRRRENRLQLDTADWDMVRRWAADGPARSPGTRLRWFRERIDDDILPAFAEVFTEVFNQQPFGESSFRGLELTPDDIREHEATACEAGGIVLTLISQEQDGMISGLTEMTYYPMRPTMIGQGLTGVRDRYRGRGLGKWLKATMLLRVREVFPDVRIVTTGNASSNAAMLSINERLGFRLHKESWIAEFSLKTVEGYLAARSTRHAEVV